MSELNLGFASSLAKRCCLTKSAALGPPWPARWRVSAVEMNSMVTMQAGFLRTVKHAKEPHKAVATIGRLLELQRSSTQSELDRLAVMVQGQTAHTLHSKHQEPAWAV